MRLCYVGPTDPKKGALGIISYISLLSNELGKKHEIIFISFNKIYPFISFPKKTVDFSLTGNNFNILSVYQPVTWFKALKIINKMKPNVIHFHWWSSILNPCYFIMLFFLKGYKTVITCHNPISHERAFLFKSLEWLNKVLFKLTDKIIVDNNVSKNFLVKKYPKLKNKISVIPFGNLIRYHNHKISIMEAKDIFELDKNSPCLLFFGYVREYKGLSYLIRAIKDIDCHLIIAGKFIDPLENYTELIEKLGIKSKIKIFPNVIPEKEIPFLFKAADMVVLPYTKFFSGSGVAHSAIEFGKPIIATKCKGFKELFTDGLNACLVPTRDSNSLRDAIIKLINDPKKMHYIGINAKKLSNKFTWHNTAEMYTCLYQNLFINKFRSV